MSIEYETLVANAVAGGRPSEKGWIRANCPLCEFREGKADRKRSFGLNVRSLWYECYRCGAKGRLRKPIEEYEHLHEQEPEPPPPIVQPEGFYFLDESTWDAVSLSPAWDYLLGVRKMSFDHIVDNRLGACVAGRFAGRVIIPIFHDDGRWAWFVGRAWQKKADIPYLYPVGDRQGVMFNHPALRVATETPLLVMEGCFDAIPYAPDAVAALGKVTDERVIDVMRGVPRPVVFVPDGDEWEAGYAAAMRLRLDGHRAGALRLPPKADPDELPVDQVRAAALASLDVSIVDV